MRSLSHKERYLGALFRKEIDCVPCAPELFFLVPARLTGLKFYEVSPGSFFLPKFHKVPLWKAQLGCAKFFDVCGWITVFPKMISNDLEEEANVIYRNEEVVEIHLFKSTNKMVFREVFVAPRDDAPWLLERPVKAFEDWIEYKKFLFPPSFEIVAEEIEEAYKETGDAGIVSLAISGLFFDLLISSREGGLEKVFEDLFEHPSFFKRLHREFIDHTKEKMKALCKVTKKFDEFFVGCSYSAIPIINPKLYREWEIPFLREITEFAHMFGKPLHLHQHGRVMGIIEDIAEAGVDLLCPLESPPLGDVDLGLVKRRFGDRLALKGNVRTRVLCEGTLGEIEAEVKDCIYKAASGGGFVLGTGDQVHRDTPFENIVFMRELCKRYGSYPISVTSG